nr:uncharacterized mitochondrial protein AtMg00810-like [Tanacetum cinerariifolium]
MSYLTDYEEIHEGYVAFGGNPKEGKITGRGTIKLVLLKVPRKNNMYSVDLKNIIPKGDLTCLFAKSTSDESKLWHRRLGHLNFKTMNKLVKGNLVRGLPSKLFENNQDCVACQKEKQHRASSERRNKTLIEAARTMLANSNLPTTSWAEAVNTACYVQNRVLVVKPHNKTPYELFYGRTPALSFMRPFGCPVTSLNTKDHLGKFDGKADEGFFVGYSLNNKAFKVFNNRIKILEENLHIRFSENTPNIAGSRPNWLFDIDALTKSMNYKPVVIGNQSNDNAGTKACDDAGKARIEMVDEDPRQESECKYQKKEDNVNNTNNVNAAGTNGVNVVGTNTNNELPFDPKMPVLENISIFTFSNKDEHDSVEADMNNLDTTIHVSPVPTTRIHKDHPIDQIEEEVYVFQPLVFEDPDFLDKVYKVEKALYGLHQAPRAWYETLSTYLLDNRFHKGKIDKTLFIRRHKIDILLVQVYVDDIIFGSTKKELCNAFKKMMDEKFQMSSIGELTFFLGLQVKQKQDEIFISQDKYVAEIIKKYGFSKVKNANTPMETQKPLLKDEDGKDVDVHMYRSMIGLLMYLISSRLDIMFAVYACARYQVNPKVSHLYVVKRIFSDYARANLDRKSITGGCQYMRCRLISWQCKKQTVVVNSTTEAEYVAALSCCGQFWTTVKAKTVNGEVQLQALVVGKKVIITKSTIKSDLQLEDAEGVDCLPNAAIFEQLTLIGKQKPSKTKRKDTELPQTSVPLSVADKAVNKEMYDSLERARRIADIDANKDIYLVNVHTDKDVFGVNDLDDDEVIVEDVEMLFDVADDLRGKEVFVSQEVPLNSADATTTAATIDDITLAQALLELKSAKPKATTTTAATIITATSLRPKAKGIVIMNKSKHLYQQFLHNNHHMSWTRAKAKWLNQNLAEEKRNKPPIQAQQRKIMCTYLKNMEGKKLTDLKNKSFDSIQKMFDRSFTRVNTFIDFKTELVEESSKKSEAEITQEGSLKRIGDGLEQERSKKQKVDDDKESEELKKCLEILLDDGYDVAIDATPLSSKSPTIVDYKIYQERKKAISKFSELMNQQELVKVKNWKLYDSCGVHCVTMQNILYYLLVEKMYPLTNHALHQMFNVVKLQVDYECEMVYELLRLVKKQLKEGYVSQ